MEKEINLVKLLRETKQQYVRALILIEESSTEDKAAAVRIIEETRVHEGIALEAMTL